MKTYKMSDIAPFLKEEDEVKLIDVDIWHVWHVWPSTLLKMEDFVLYRPAGSLSKSGELCEAYEESLKPEPFDPKDLSKLKKGDIIERDGEFSLILARLEDIVFRSKPWGKRSPDGVRAEAQDITCGRGWLLEELKRRGWTIYREPETIETIEIDGKKYRKADIQKLNPITQ